MSIEVNKGWIHGEIRDFLLIFWKSIKSVNEFRWEIREIFVFEKRTQRQIHGIINHLIWIKIRGEIKEQIREKSEMKD